MADQALENDNTQTIFASNEPAVEPASDNNVDQQTGSQPLSVPEELQDFIGEGKKYSSLEDALKSIPHAQKHISVLEQENKTYKEQIDKVQSMEELLKQMQAQQMTKDENTTPPVENEGADDLLNKLSSQLDSLVEQKLSLKQQEAVHSQNAQTVTKAFKEAFGDKAEDAYKGLSEETGLSIDSLNQMAATSPKALLKLAGLSNKTGTIPAKQSSTVNTEAFIANANGQKQEVKPVMFGATSSQVLDAWRASKPV